jgi:hypothetical protein
MSDAINVAPDLTYEQWTFRHKQKLAGLSNPEKKRRYRQYILSSGIAGSSIRRKEMKDLAKLKIDLNQPLNKAELTMGSFSHCSKLYAAAMSNPWACESAPCVPDLVTLPSYKVGFRSRGVFEIGTEGVGFVTLNPYNVTSKTSPLLVHHTGTYTTAAYAANSYKEPPDPGINFYDNDSPYAPLDISPEGITWRCVGAGLKCRYTGTEITRAGRCVVGRTPFNTPLIAGSNANAFLVDRAFTVNPVDRKYHFCTYRPAKSTDTTYVTENVGENWSMICYVEGSEPGSSFEFDAIQWFELIGKPLPQMTRSHSDPTGMSVIMESLSLAQPQRTPEENHKSLWDEMFKTVQTSLSLVGPALGSFINNVGGFGNVLPALGAMLL